MKSELEKLKYPIGRFNLPTNVSYDAIQEALRVLEDFPMKLTSATSSLSRDQLDYRYRPEGWTIKQVVHHCADSHMNSIIRFKLALTEKQPIIKPYLEDKWADLTDYQDYDLDAPLSILRGVHHKLVQILSNLDSKERSKTFKHPEHGQLFRIDQALMLYAWHSRHHLAHVEQAIKFEGSNW